MYEVIGMTVTAVVCLASGATLLLRGDLTYRLIDESYGKVVNEGIMLPSRNWHLRNLPWQRRALRWSLPLGLLVVGFAFAAAPIAALFHEFR
jgi:hypothetical protein